MSKPKVTIGIILFTRSETYLKYSLPSLLNQNYPNIELILRDQSPNHEIYSWMQKEMPEVFERATVQKGPNRMHSGGHNDIINQMRGDYYVVASNDMLYPIDFVSKVVEEMEKPENAQYGTASPKLMQWNFALAQNGELEKSKTNVIDSCGVGVKKTHHFYDVGQGQTDEGQYDNTKEIFGASGALTVIRKSALKDIEYKGQYYDELMHYKNDVDLAYRLNWAGHKCLFLPNIKVYHDRFVGNDEGIITSRKNRAKWTKDSSLFGHLVVLEKNYDKRFSFATKLKTRLYNNAKLLFMAIREPRTLKQYFEVNKKVDEIEAKKKHMKKVVTPSTIENLMS